MKSDRVRVITLCVFGLIAADNEAVTAGNLTGGGAKNIDGSLKGARSIYNDKDQQRQNVDILHHAFERSFRDHPLSDANKAKMRDVMDHAAHGSVNTIMHIIEQGIITPDEGDQLKQNAQHTPPSSRRQAPSKPTSSSPGPADEDTPATPLDEGDELNPPLNIPSFPLSERPTPEGNTSLNSQPKKSPKQPGNPYTMKVPQTKKPGPSDEQLADQQHNKNALNEFINGMAKGAYDRSLARGLSPEEADANAQAAKAYARAYNDYKAQGHSPDEADKKARSVFRNMGHIAPNAKGLWDDINTMQIIEESREHLPIGMLGERYPSDMLANEAEHAKHREQTQKENRKNMAKLVSSAIQQDNDLKDRIEHELKEIVEKLQQVREMKKQTIENRADGNNNKPGDLEDSDVAQTLEERQQTYEEMVEAAQAPPKKRNLKDLNIQKDKDDKMMHEHQETFTHYVDEMKQQAEEHAQHADEMRQQIEIEEHREAAMPVDLHEPHDNEQINRTLTETAEQRADEEGIAQKQIDQVVQEAGTTAYNNVISMNGTQEYAQEARSMAEKLKTEQINQKLEEQIKITTEQLAGQMDPETAAQMSKHIVTVHELKNIIHIPEEEHVEVEQVQEKPKILSVVSDDENEMKLENVVMTFPLPADVDLLPHTAQDQANLTAIEERKEEFRNTRIDTHNTAFYTGLPTVVGNDGSTTVFSEGLKSIAVGKGHIEVDELTAEKMKEEGLDMSPFKPIITQDGTIHKMDLVDAIVDLGTDGDRQAITARIGDETVPLGSHPGKLFIDNGLAQLTPFSELRDIERPILKKSANPSDLDDNDPVEGDLIEQYKEIERKQGDAEQVQVDVFKNKDTGDTVVKQSPTYGTPKTQTMEKAKDQANGKGNSHVTTETTTITYDMMDLPERNSPDVQNFLNEAAKGINEPVVAENNPFVKVEPKSHATQTTTLETNVYVPQVTDNSIQQAVNEVHDQTVGEPRENLSHTVGTATTETTTIHFMEDGRPMHRSNASGTTTVTETRSPLNSVNPMTGEVNTEMETQTGQTTTVDEMIMQQMVPVKDAGDEIYNDMLKSAPEISENLHAPVLHMIESMSRVSPQKINELVHQMKKNDNPETITTTIESISQLLPKEFRKPITNYVVGKASQAAGTANPLAQVVSKKPVGNTVTARNPDGTTQTFTGQSGTSQVVQRIRTDGVPTVQKPSKSPTPAFDMVNPVNAMPNPNTNMGVPPGFGEHSSNQNPSGNGGVPNIPGNNSGTPGSNPNINGGNGGNSNVGGGQNPGGSPNGNNGTGEYPGANGGQNPGFNPGSNGGQQDTGNGMNGGNGKTIYLNNELQ